MWGGVYYIDELSSPMAQVNVVGSHDLWHERLGHHSNQVLSLLPKNFNISITRNKEPCNVCFHAKQTRTKFVDSHSHETELFGLIILIFGEHTKFLSYVVHNIFYNC